jgi:hypothetical protein
MIDVKFTKEMHCRMVFGDCLAKAEGPIQHNDVTEARAG